MSPMETIELGGVQPTPTKRHPTLESQRQRGATRKWRRFNPWRSTGAAELDAAGSLIAAAAKKQAVGSSFIKYFGHLYRRPDKALLRNVGLSISCPPVVSPPEAKVGKEDDLQGWCKTLHSVSNQVFTDVFLVFECTARASVDNAAAGYKLLHVFEQNRIMMMREVAQRASLLLLSEEKTWNVPPEIVNFFDESSSKGLRATYDITLPSQQQANEEYFRVSPGNARFILTWQSHAPQYKNDLDTYIWRSFTNPPKSDYASITILDNHAPRDIRMVLILKDEASMRDFREQRKIPASSRHFWSAGSELISALDQLLSLATSALVNFLKEASTSTRFLTFEARRTPRTEKVQYLLHLKDCVEKAEEDVRNNLSQLDEMDRYLVDLASLNSDIRHDIFAKGLYQDDLKYLRAELKKLGENIDRLQNEIEALNALKSRNTTMLTFLAAVYVPLAFVTSFLGMNITDSAPSNHPNITDPHPSNHPNDPPSARLWSIRWFYYLAAPLLFVTIILPILAGPSVRQLLQWYIRLRNFWRVGFLIFWISYTIAVNLPEPSYWVIVPYDAGISLISMIRLYDVTIGVGSRQRRERHLFSRGIFAVFAGLCFGLDFIVPWVDMGTFAWIALPLTMFYEYRHDARGKNTQTNDNEVAG